MKDAIIWQHELAGETSVQSIREIQLDALSFAAAVIAAGAPRWQVGFDALHRKIVELTEEKN